MLAIPFLLFSGTYLLSNLYLLPGTIPELWFHTLNHLSLDEDFHNINLRKLGPGTFCCSACTWTNLPSINRRQRNYKGLKITECSLSWGRFWTKDTNRPEDLTATFEEQLAKAGIREQKQGFGSKSRVLHMPPAHTIT